MKSLVFNLAVAAALVYLFVAPGRETGSMLGLHAMTSTAPDSTGDVEDQQPPPSATDHTAAAKAVDKKSTSAAPNDSEGPEKVAAVPLDSPQEEPVGDSVSDRSAEVSATPPQASQVEPSTETAAPQAPASPAQDAKPVPLLSPEVAQRRAEVLGEKPVTSMPTEPVSPASSVAEKRWALQALAEEMTFRAMERIAQ